MVVATQKSDYALLTNHALLKGKNNIKDIFYVHREFVVIIS